MLQGIHTSLAFLSLTPLSLTISTNQPALNLRTWAISQGWDESVPLIVTISSGVYIYGVNGTALTISGSFPGGLLLINDGFILGDGGNGGAGGAGGFGGTGGVGGVGGGGYVGLVATTPVSVQNNNVIAGGGGGGGGGGGTSYLYVSLPGGGGGGGRTGLSNTAGGSPNGGIGTYLAPGNGGPGSAYIYVSGAGGTGGQWGANGNNGGAATNRGGGAGGAGGAAVSGNSNITWLATGTRYGSIL